MQQVTLAKKITKGFGASNQETDAKKERGPPINLHAI
jgi:hypothetical protein